MRLPIDTSRLKFLVVAPAEPLRQFEEGKPREAWAPRTDANGEVLWRVQLVALGDGEAEIIRVAVPGTARCELVVVQRGSGGALGWLGINGADDADLVLYASAGAVRGLG